MFRNDIWLAEPNKGELYKTENGVTRLISDKVDKNISCVMVSQDTVSTYIASMSTNRLTHIRAGIIVNNSIDVGAIPTAMCEDGNGVIWVANYGDNTVSKVVNDKVVKTIPVPSGPRDIVADSRNNVFVVCYLANKLVHIVNDVVVEEMDTFLAPRAVTCDVSDNILVVCYQSGVLSKYSSGRKMTDYDLRNAFNTPSPGPVDIVTDSNANIYIASYYGEVVRIKLSITGDPQYTLIPVPANPTSLAVDADDTIYVTSETTGTVTPIVDGVAGSPFYVCDNPIGFGDFTGCATYNIYHDNIAAGSTGPWHISNMDTEIQQLLNQIKTGSVNTSADLVSYASTTFPTVEAALNSLLNIDPIIYSFDVLNNVFEDGAVVTDLQVTWSLNKAMASGDIRLNGTIIADLADGSGDPIPQEGSKIISGFSIAATSSQKSFNLSMRVVDENGNSYTKSTIISFENKFLYGALPDSIVGTFPSPNDLDQLSKSPVVKDPYGYHFKIDCGLNADKVPCIAVPKSWNIKLEQIAFLNGYSNDWVKTTTVWTNSSGGNIEYDVFLYQTPLAGEVIAYIVKLLSF